MLHCLVVYPKKGNSYAHWYPVVSSVCLMYVVCPKKCLLDKHVSWCQVYPVSVWCISYIVRWLSKEGATGWACGGIRCLSGDLYLALSGVLSNVGEARYILMVLCHRTKISIEIFFPVCLCMISDHVELSLRICMLLGHTNTHIPMLFKPNNESKWVSYLVWGEIILWEVHFLHTVWNYVVSSYK